MLLKYHMQGLGGQSTRDSLLGLLAIDGPQRIILASAFATERGINQIAARLKKVANLTTLFIGVRNDVTTAQGLLRALALGCDVYVVDTGTRHRIFHPKVSVAIGAATTNVFIGSGNLTSGGLITNIETSLVLSIDSADTDVASLGNEICLSFDNMRAAHPKNVRQVASSADVLSLLERGLVLDEATKIFAKSLGSSKAQAGDTTPVMVLSSTQLLGVAPISVVPKMVAPLATQKILVWQSSPLTRRDLTIPTGLNTNQTGSMLMKKGRATDVDQRHYFRDDVFGALVWKPDVTPGKLHMERATAKFEIVVLGVDYGEFELDLSHNTKTDSTAYLQKNSMTSLHWGAAREHIAKEYLLGHTLSIYRAAGKPDEFAIEIET